MARLGRRGFSMIELLVAAGIFGVVSAVLLSMTLVGRKMFFSAHNYVYLQQEARRALTDMTKELLQAGQVNGNASLPSPGAQRLDFQIVTGYDAIACGGSCWGTDEAALPTGWLHYAVDAVTMPPHPRLVRCATAGRLDALPAGFAGCRVLANDISADAAITAFLYDHSARTVTLTLQTSVSSMQLPGGGLSTVPVPLRIHVRLRNVS